MKYDNLDRFIDAQEKTYLQALYEIETGRKQSHWMWYILPQLAGLGKSDTSQCYAIKDLKEATLYANHPLLGTRLIEILKKLLFLKDKTAYEVFGNPDDLKLRSCMSLFSSVPGADPVFQMVLDKYFNGKKDLRTMELLKESK